jgi:hypothetical protein
MFNMSISGLGQNGFMNMIATSQEKTDIMLADFDKIISELGYTYPPQEILAEILKLNRISENDLTDFDKRRLMRKVEEVLNGGIYNE